MFGCPIQTVCVINKVETVELRTMFTHSLFDDIFAVHPLVSPRVLVISDSEYKRLQQKQIQEQIAVLESRAASQRKQLEATEQAIAELKESIAEHTQQS